MKTVTYVLSYIFTSNIFIILYGLVATTGLTIQDVDFQQCGDVFFAIILAYIACIVVVLLILIRCVQDCFHYTLEDTDTQVVIQRHSGRKALLVLTSILLHLWNIVIAIKSTSGEACTTYFYRTHRPLIALNHIMASNAGLICFLFIGLWVKKRYRNRPVLR